MTFYADLWKAIDTPGISWVEKESAMETAQFWKSLFENWPDALECQGTVISKQGEVVPFVNYLLSGGLVLLERSGPDASGARKAIVSFDQIAMIKLPSPAPLTNYTAMGFQPRM